jgi:hypothetical protein
VRSIRTGRPPGRVMTAGHGCRCRWPFKV